MGLTSVNQLKALEENGNIAVVDSTFMLVTTRVCRSALVHTEPTRALVILPAWC